MRRCICGPPLSMIALGLCQEHHHECWLLSCMSERLPGQPMTERVLYRAFQEGERSAAVIAGGVRAEQPLWWLLHILAE